MIHLIVSLYLIFLLIAGVIALARPIGITLVVGLAIAALWGLGTSYGAGVPAAIIGIPLALFAVAVLVKLAIEGVRNRRAIARLFHWRHLFGGPQGMLCVLAAAMAIGVVAIHTGALHTLPASPPHWLGPAPPYAMESVTGTPPR